MKTEVIEVCEANVFSISCEHNDSVDIRCGGPAILGYDFGVSPDEDKEDIKKFLRETIKKYHQPLNGISVYKQKNFPVKHLWTKERICHWSLSCCMDAVNYCVNSVHRRDVVIHPIRYLPKRTKRSIYLDDCWKRST